MYEYSIFYNDVKPFESSLKSAIEIKCNCLLTIGVSKKKRIVIIIVIKLIATVIIVIPTPFFC